MTKHYSVFGLVMIGIAASVIACGGSSDGGKSNGAVAGAGSGGRSGAGGASGGSSGSGAGASAGGKGGAGGASGANTAGSVSSGTGGDAGKGGAAASGTGGGAGAAGAAADSGSGGHAGGGEAGDGSGGSGAGSGGQVGACEGFPVTGRTLCTRDGQECMGFGYCRFPGDSPACGIPCFAERECESDDECSDGVCEESQASCCPDGTLASRCVAACTTSSCDEGQQCLTSGHCECIPGACPTNKECTPNAQGLLTCQRKACASDSESACDCGGCYDGFCTPPPDEGYCELPVP